MPSLVSSIEKSGVLKDFSNSFDTWSRTIIIYKDPIKTPTVVPQSSSALFGFGEIQQNVSYTTTQNTGIFQAVIRYNDIERNPAHESVISPELLARIYSGPISIKVKRDCRDFLNNGVTDSVVLDNQVFLVNSDERLQTYMGSEYYIFSLRKTK